MTTLRATGDGRTVVWSDDNETVTCPDCGETWADLWDYSWGTVKGLSATLSTIPRHHHRGGQAQYPEANATLA